MVTVFLCKGRNFKPTTAKAEQHFKYYTRVTFTHCCLENGEQYFTGEMKAFEHPR